jgi:TldD protein
MPRMTNTYMLAGRTIPREILASVDKGLYAVNFGGGQVDITVGQVRLQRERGLSHRRRQGDASGEGRDAHRQRARVLTRVSMVGSDLELDQGVGVCGKEGQSVPVGVGQPTLRIDRSPWRHALTIVTRVTLRDAF